MSPIRVGIVAPHLVLRAGLRHYFQVFRDLCVVGEFEHLVDAQQLALLRADALVIDTHGANWSRLTELRGALPGVGSVLLAAPEHLDAAQRLLSLRLVTYVVDKLGEPEHILEAVRALAESERAQNDHAVET